MSANPDDALDDEYEDLTEKQRAVIDAHAQHPDETNREKARIAGEDILDQAEPVNESYCSEVLNKKFPELAEYRRALEQGDEPEQREKVTVASIPGPPAGAPHRVQAADTGDGVTMALSYDYIQELLADQAVELPPEMHEELVNVVFARAFDG